MYVARPFALNNSRQKNFESIEDACRYLAEETEHDLHPEDWIALGKILEVKSDGSCVTPKVFSVVKKQQVVKKKFDIDSLL